MVQQLPYDITEYYFDGNCNEFGSCDEEHKRCVYSNCCNVVECVFGNYYFEFPFAKNYQERGVDLSLLNDDDNSDTNSNNFSNTNKKKNNNNKPTQNVKTNKNSDNKIKTDTDKNINQKPNPNINNINKNPITYNNINSNNTNSNGDNSNGDNRNNQNIAIDNVSNIKTSSVDNNIDQKTIEEKNQKNSLISLPLISIVIIVIIGTVLSVSILRKKKNSKSKKENINVKTETSYNTNANDTSSNESLIKIKSIHNISDIKDPVESCEEYLNSLSRLRYTDHTLSINSTNKPKPYFPLFMSPSLSPIVAPTESFISNNSISNLAISQPIIVDPQFENEPSSQSVEVTQISITEAESEQEQEQDSERLDLKIQTSDCKNIVRSESDSITNSQTPMSNVTPSIFRLYGDDK